jgi:hypothetical protein
MALDLNSLSVFAKSDSFPFFTFRSMMILTAMFSTSPFFYDDTKSLGRFQVKLFWFAFTRLRRIPRPWPWRNALMRDIPFQRSIYHASADFAHRRMTHRSLGVGGYGFGGPWACPWGSISLFVLYQNEVTVLGNGHPYE